MTWKWAMPSSRRNFPLSWALWRISRVTGPFGKIWGFRRCPEYKLRTFAAVDRDNFDDIMKTVAPALKLSGLDRFITEDASAAWREEALSREGGVLLCAAV